MGSRPNVLLITTDQHRGDALGADPACPTDRRGDPVVHTPNIDSLIGEGAIFSRAYTPAPSSIPARRCLWTGRTPANCNATTYHDEPWTFGSALPEVLRDAGYQTRLTGKTHAIPARNHFGFEDAVVHAGLYGLEDDYAEWLERESDGQFDELSHGVGRNSWDARPWHLPEHYHPTNWTTDRAIEFFETRDPTRPFFQYVSYVRPHQPYDPPQPYWDVYADREIPEPPIGDWAEEVYGDRIPDYPALNAWLADLPDDVVRRARIGYYGSITHVDHQINRLLRALERTEDGENTLVIFCSDHGDLLGDHHLWRKVHAYEGSARVPLVIRFSPDMEYETGREIDRPVGLEDVMPTILEATGVATPDAVDGRSLLELLADYDCDDWRSYYHGEHGPTYDRRNGTQFLVDETTKYVWNPVTGTELLFDLESDPRETRNLADDAAHREELERWRGRLVDHLEDRSEGFSDGERLLTVEPEGTWPNVPE